MAQDIHFYVKLKSAAVLATDCWQQINTNTLAQTRHICFLQFLWSGSGTASGVLCSGSLTGQSQGAGRAGAESEPHWGRISFRTRLLETFSSLCAIVLSSSLTVGPRLTQRPLHYDSLSLWWATERVQEDRNPLSFVIFSQKLHPITFAVFYSLGVSHQV